MSILFQKPRRERNWTKALMHGILAAVEASSPAGPNIHNIVLQLHDALKEVAGRETDSIDNRAWNWAAKTLTYAVCDILVQSRKIAPLAPRREIYIQEFLKNALEFGDAQLDWATLFAPSLSPTFAPAKLALPELLLGSTTSQDLGLDTLKARFDWALQLASNRVICENPTYFKPLEDALVSVGGELVRREADWARHSFWISSQFTDEPVFSPDSNETISLASVYLRLRCCRNEEIVLETNDLQRREFYRIASVSNLHETLHSWLEEDALKDPIRVVAGGPGSGKSSFARAFAHELIQDTKKHRVALIRLQHTHLSGQLDQDIANYFGKFDTRTSPKGNPGLPESPLEWRKDDATPLLLVFDGLDELTADARDAEKYAREFLLSLVRMLQPLNTDGPPVRAIVLGRNIACERAMTAASLPLPTLLNVSPIAPLTRRDLGLPSRVIHEKQDIFDPDNLIKLDQRETYWRQWAKLKGMDPNEIPAPVTDKSMTALNLEPLLLHLLINSKYCGSDWSAAADNRNLVYEDILEKIYRRNDGKNHFATHSISRDNFFDLMEVLGLAAWRGNGRTGNEDEFCTVRKLHLRKEKYFKKVAAASLESVALNIHTRTGQGVEDGGFEFIHKSFGEFLSARGMLSHAIRISHKLAEYEEPELLSEAYCKLISGAELSPYILRFLYDEARRRLEPSSAAQIKDGLTEMINWVLVNGFPVTRAFSGLSWRELENCQRCAESALLATASAVASTIPLNQREQEGLPSPTIDLDLRVSPNASLALVSRLAFDPDSAVKRAFRRINFSCALLTDVNLNGADLRGTDLSETVLSGADLRGTDLLQANLSGALLTDANLSATNLRCANMDVASSNGTSFVGANMTELQASEADLVGANFESADLSDAKLDHSDMSGANFDGAELIGASLVGTYFANASLNGANLIDTNLCEAELSGAEMTLSTLSGANLHKALLFGANLTEAELIRTCLKEVDMTEAQCKDANFVGADLCDANANGSNLTGANLSQTNLSGATFITTDLRSANLEQATLNRASLIRASLNGANLSGANLSHANLREAKLGTSNLSGVDFSEANLENANLNMAKLHSANLVQAKNLTQEQINSALGNAQTQLPDDITRPKNWYDKNS